MNMVQVYVVYNPYRLTTTIEINGNPIEVDSPLYKYVRNRRLQEWVGDFPDKLKETANALEFDITFYGMDVDWDDFEAAFQQANAANKFKALSIKFKKAVNDSDVTEKISKIFKDLQEGPVEEFKSKELIRAFENIKSAVFPVHVIATMSSGKSTLINALLQRKLMPAKNQACTAMITEIIDNDRDTFAAKAYDNDDNCLAEVSEFTLEAAKQLNEDNEIFRVVVEGNIPFLDARDMALSLVDTPGPNNSQNSGHKNTTYQAINSDSNNLILYVLNGTNLGVNDDAELLDYVADIIRKTGKLGRDRFLFVINKMDGFNPEEESIEAVINEAKEYLQKHGIDDPQIFPCSAYTALNIRTELCNVDVNNLTRNEERALPKSARDALSNMDNFIDYEDLHLEQYTTLAPSAKQKLEYHLEEAKKTGNRKEEALIHCGIYSIEEAIKAYVKKYAKTKKVKDLVDSFQAVMESTQILAKTKAIMAENDDAAEACRMRAEAVMKQIANGEEAGAFKKKIEELNPKASMAEKTRAIRIKIEDRVEQVFGKYPDTITSKNEAQQMIKHFGDISSDATARLATELGSIIQHEIIDVGDKLLMEYQERLERFDAQANVEGLDFSTSDLVKGALSRIKANIEEWQGEDFANDMTEELGETTVEQKTYYEKVGEKEEKIITGTKQVSIGKEKVFKGYKRIKVRTEKVSNPNKKWWNPFSWFDSSTIDKDIYEDVPQYEEKDVYKTVNEYKTVMRDIFEQRTQRIEHFSVDKGVIQRGLVSKFRQSVDEGIKAATDEADERISKLKQNFTDSFTEVDRKIEEKYKELENYASDQTTKEAAVKENQKTLAWIEINQREIDELLDMGGEYRA